VRPCEMKFTRLILSRIRARECFIEPCEVFREKVVGVLYA